MGHVILCDSPGCSNEVKYDLVLYERDDRFKSKRVMRHDYLCTEHALEFYEFLDAYEGGDK